MIMEICKIGIIICLWEILRQIIKESQPGMSPWFFSNKADPQDRKENNNVKKNRA